MIVKIIFSILVIAGSSSISLCEDEVEQNPFEYTQAIRKKLELIQTISPEEYPKSIDTLRGDMEKYIDHKKRVCDGEFSMIIMGEEESKGRKTGLKKLSKSERKLCYRELKSLQVTFINNTFVARKRYLEHIQKLSIYELEKSRDKALKSIQKSFMKKI